MSIPILEITANVGGPERRDPKSIQFKGRIVQGLLASIFHCTASDLNNAALSNNVPQIKEMREGKVVIFYEVSEIRPLLKGLQEVSDEIKRPWLFDLDLDGSVIEVAFPQGRAFRYFEKEEETT